MTKGRAGRCWERGDCRRGLTGPCENAWDDGEDPAYCHRLWSAILCCQKDTLYVYVSYTTNAFPYGTIVCGVFTFINMRREKKYEKK